MGKKRLLYISAETPKPTGGGSEMRVASHIGALSDLFDVTLAIIGDQESEVKANKFFADHVKSNCASIVVVDRISVINRFFRGTSSYWAHELFEALLLLSAAIPARPR